MFVRSDINNFYYHFHVERSTSQITYVCRRVILCMTKHCTDFVRQ
uniref:Uncharacterized protein n=1 Tax=Arundo donax TaxID=35708 RepID=A0A0A8ZP26_ARUDO